eukprot:1156630-Pelagomonas_calceolata.AAC.6
MAQQAVMLAPNVRFKRRTNQDNASASTQKRKPHGCSGLHAGGSDANTQYGVQAQYKASELAQKFKLQYCSISCLDRARDGSNHVGSEIQAAVLFDLSP